MARDYLDVYRRLDDYAAPAVESAQAHIAQSRFPRSLSAARFRNGGTLLGAVPHTA
jgi:hypothetical protein